MKRALWTPVVLGGLAVAAIVVVSVGVAVWPGSLKLTAPVLCPSEQSDAFVVRTTTSSSNGSGTSTSFSLFCMGDRGDFTEVGTWEPYGLLFLSTWGFLVALALVVVLMLVVPRTWRAVRRGSDVGPPDPAPSRETGPISPIS